MIGIHSIIHSLDATRHKKDKNEKRKVSKVSKQADRPSVKVSVKKNGGNLDSKEARKLAEETASLIRNAG